MQQTSQDRYINETAKSKGLLIRIGWGHYVVIIPNAGSVAIDTKVELQRFIRDY